MWDLIVSVPDHCLSFYFSSFDGASIIVSFSSLDDLVTYLYAFMTS